MWVRIPPAAPNRCYMTWLEYYKMRLERLEKSRLKTFMSWDTTCAYFFYAMCAKQYADEYILPKD